MKNIQIIFLIIITTGLFSCSKKLAPPGYNGEVNYLRNDNKGTVTVQSLGFGRDKNESYLNAKATSFYILFFRGLAVSDYNLPLIPNENNKKDDPIVKNLLDGDFSTFITSVYTISEATKVGKYYQCELEITINYDALRKYLEQNNIIRKFGF